MKSRLIYLTVLCLVLLASPVARTEVYMDYDFSSGLVWQVGGFEVYDIMQRGETVGEARIEYSELTMMDADAIRVEYSQNWTTADDEMYIDETDAKMRASDLKAYMSTRIYTIGEDEWRYEGNYTGESLQFGTYVPGDATRHEASLTRSGRFVDADILPFALRNIPFEDGNFITLTTIDVATHSFITPIARVTGSEIVETSNTQYDCWVVNVSLGQGGFTAWYSKNEMHYLVKIRYDDREIVLNHHS